MGPNSVVRIASRIVARNTNLPLLELATGFEVLNMQRRKKLRQVRWNGTDCARPGLGPMADPSGGDGQQTR
jgi:hypothetical protein